ncbi:MAG: hypothetical protein ABEH47_04330, partial [Haloferacaceae archaeon]
MLAVTLASAVQRLVSPAPVGALRPAATDGTSLKTRGVGRCPRAMYIVIVGAGDIGTPLIEIAT